MTVGIGITTFNRGTYLEKCAKAMKRHLYINGVPVFWKLACYNDGSDPKFHAEYERAYKPIRSMGGRVLEGKTNLGVACAKNALIDHLLADPEVDWVILVEDDILTLSPEAVTGYIAAAESAGLHHLSWCDHPYANPGGPNDVAGEVAYYDNLVGAWCLYSRECLKRVGGFDENFHNAWEHVELSIRLTAAGYYSDPHHFADAARASEWLQEMPGSIKNSAIRGQSSWSNNIRDGLIYWRDNKPDTYKMLFGSGTRLEQYAHNIIG